MARARQSLPTEVERGVEEGAGRLQAAVSTTRDMFFAERPLSEEKARLRLLARCAPLPFDDGPRFLSFHYRDGPVLAAPGAPPEARRLLPLVVLPGMLTHCGWREMGLIVGAMQRYFGASVICLEGFPHTAQMDDAAVEAATMTTPLLEQARASLAPPTPPPPLCS